MKSAWITLLSLFLMTQLPQGLNAQNNSQDYLYTVHIGAFVKTQLSDFERIHPLGFIYAENFDNSLMRVYMGNFDKEAEARQLLDRIKAKGYPDAYVTRRPYDVDQQLNVIQLGTEQNGQQINWGRYVVAGDLHVQTDGKLVKIMTGPFDTQAALDRKLRLLRQGGFKDAFAKQVAAGRLHAITEFEAGGQLLPAVDQFTNEEMAAKNPVAVPAVEITEKTAPPAEVIPSDYEAAVAVSAPAPMELPRIRTRVKRNSVIELQKVLKKYSNYKSSLDGLYGKGTAGAYDYMMSNNTQAKKYQLLARYAEQIAATTPPNSLQYFINTLPQDGAAALAGLEASRQPVAKAYRAYADFITRGSSREVDQLMNTAIQEAFRNVRPADQPPFDHTATYSYQSLDQLLQHLRYVQTAAEAPVAVPCWLFRQHPTEAAKAFGNDVNNINYRIAGCDDLMDWPELALLQTIATDLNPTGKTDAGKQARYNAQRAQMLLLANPLDSKFAKAVETWHQKLWTGLDQWAAGDALHAKFVVPLRAAYWQSVIRLEDYYMDKGVDAKAARSLALATVRTMVDAHLSEYSD